MGMEDAEARRLAKIIDHPIRARIIDLLGEKGALGWKELSTELGVKTGALYHHLDTLEGLVERDTAKKYSLTKSGKIVYSMTSESRTIDSVRRAALEIKREGTSRRLASSIFIPRSLLGYLASTRSSAAAALVGVVAALAAFSGWAGISPTLYYLHPDPGLVPTVGALLGSLAALVILCYVAARFVFRSNVDPLSLAAVSSFSFLPVFAASALVQFPPVASLFASSSAAFTLTLVFFQTWSSTILGAGLSIASGVRIERTLLVSLAILYATMVVMLVQGPKL